MRAAATPPGLRPRRLRCWSSERSSSSDAAARPEKSGARELLLPGPLNEGTERPDADCQRSAGGAFVLLGAFGCTGIVGALGSTDGTGIRPCESGLGGTGV